MEMRVRVCSTTGKKTEIETNQKSMLGKYVLLKKQSIYTYLCKRLGEAVILIPIC